MYNFGQIINNFEQFTSYRTISLQRRQFIKLYQKNHT